MLLASSLFGGVVLCSHLFILALYVLSTIITVITGLFLALA